jgi:gamma-glutamylcyclotransferase (GGCT)/AIG2-like uncharacterized protein YtfP
MSARFPLFVYGSLMRGEVNHPLLAGCAFLGPARTEAGFELLDLGPYPGMVAGGRRSVAGELYRAGADSLVELDAFEGHPGTFRRTAIRLADDRPAEAYLLVAAAARGRRLVALAPEIGDVVRWRRAGRETSR